MRHNTQCFCFDKQKQKQQKKCIVIRTGISSKLEVTHSEFLYKLKDVLHL